MNWLHYLAEANIYLGVFYLAYCVFLTKETHYQLNRGYLLFSCIMSFVLPILQVGALKPAEPVAVTTSYIVPQDYIPTQIASPITITPVVEEHHLTIDDYLWYAYIIGACILLIVLAIKLYTLFKLMRNAQRIKQDKYKLVYLPETDVAFSFFNYLFIGNNAPGANTIITHELVHIRQRHSVDIIFLELLKVVSWFNPFIYLLQNSLKTVHEYIADEQTATYESDALAYSSFLVNNAYGAGGSSITHSFFSYSLLKKRIIMLNQQRSGRVARLKYLVALPLCAGLLCVSTLAFSKTYGWVDIDPAVVPVNHTAAEKPAETAITKSHINSEKRRRLPIPSFTSKGYEYLFHQVMKTVSYNPAEKDKGGFVVVGFDVANNGMLANIKIEKSGGREFDAKALKAYKTFNMPVNDKPGHRKSLVIFYNGQPTSDIDIYRGDDPNCISSWVVSDWTYNLKHTGKGFEYDEYFEHLDNKFNTRVIVYDANGKYIMVSLNEATAGELALLKSKYGYTFPPLPKGSVKFPPPIVKRDKVKFPPPIVKRDAKASNEKVDTIAKPDLQKLGRYFSQKIKYPAVDRQDTIGGRVITLFSVDANHKLQYAKVVRTPSAAMGDEIVSALQTCTEFEGLKPGVQYVLPVSFTLGYAGANNSTEVLLKSRSTGSPKTYNPNAIDIPINPPGSLILNDIVIRGYVKKP